MLQHDVLFLFHAALVWYATGRSILDLRIKELSQYPISNNLTSFLVSLVISCITCMIYSEQLTYKINPHVYTCDNLNITFKGLVKAAGELGLELLAPRKKITVLLIGNHSAGKSSFINW